MSHFDILKHARAALIRPQPIKTVAIASIGQLVGVLADRVVGVVHLGFGSQDAVRCQKLMQQISILGTASRSRKTRDQLVTVNGASPRLSHGPNTV